MHITTSIETDEGEVELTFMIERVAGGDDPEFSLDYGYIEVAEDGGKKIGRTWKQLNEIYDPGQLQVAKDAAMSRAYDEWTPDEEFTDDDYGD